MRPPGLLGQVIFLLNLGSTSKASGSARLCRSGLGKSAVETCAAPGPERNVTNSTPQDKAASSIDSSSASHYPTSSTGLSSTGRIPSVTRCMIDVTRPREAKPSHKRVQKPRDKGTHPLTLVSPWAQEPRNISHMDSAKQHKARSRTLGNMHSQLSAGHVRLIPICNAENHQHRAREPTHHLLSPS